MKVMLGRLTQAVAANGDAVGQDDGLGAGRSRTVPTESTAHPLTPGQARGPLIWQFFLFAVLGGLFTLAYAALYVLLRTVSEPQLANAIALVVTTVADTAANRRFTFGVRGRRNALLHQAQGLVLFLLGLAATSGALWWLHATAPDATTLTELVVLAVATFVVGLVRFTAFRVWVFAPPAARPRFGS